MNRNRILYFCLMLFAAALIFTNNNKAAYVMFYAMLLLPIVSLLAGHFFLARMVIRQTTDKDLILKGEETYYRVCAVNKSFFFYPDVTFNFANDHFDIDGAVFTFTPGAERDCMFPLRFRYRGIYRIGVSFVAVNDLLGLFVLKKNPPQTMQLVVYPRIIEIMSFPLSMNLLSKNFSRYNIREEDYSSVSDVRPYAPGDSMKRIHWKLSAKRNELVVKSFEATALNSVYLLVDTEKHSDSESIIIEDKMIEITVAIAYYCLKKQMPVDFYYGSSRHLAANGIADFENLYSVCAQLAFDQPEGPDAELPPLLARQTYPVNLVIVADRLNENLLNQLSGAWHFGHHVTLVYARSDEDSRQDDEIFSLLTEMGMPCYRVEPEDDIIEVF